jgi:hypothetical protein
MRFIIGGDLFISPSSFSEVQIDESIVKLFSNSDYNIVNLECPITQDVIKNKISKTGPHLCTDSRIFQVLKSLNIHVVTLANNHIMDFGNIGLIDTLEACRLHDVQYVGADVCSKRSSKTLYLVSKNIKVAIINFCENEWSTTLINDSGANPLDVIENARQISEAKLHADHVIIIVHGGHEYFNLPSPRMQKLYRFYVDQGADIIVGHHTHCMSGYEVYKGVPIYYSLGNFLFTGNSQYADWYEGLLLEINFINGKISSLLHPIKRVKNKLTLFLQTGNDKKIVLNKINIWNKTITDESSLKQEWIKFINLRRELYLSEWSILSFIHNKYIRAIFKRLGLKFINKRGFAIYLNLMLCEAHRDISVEIFKRFLKKE